MHPSVAAAMLAAATAHIAFESPWEGLPKSIYSERLRLSFGVLADCFG